MMPVALVTGPGSGIGRAIAIGLGRAGFHVVAAGRHRGRIEPVMSEIVDAGGSAEFVPLDLSSLRSVRDAASAVAAQHRSVQVLVNNAGIGINRRGLTEDGFEAHFGINHLGHFLLTGELTPALGQGARVISLASALHHRADGIDFDRLRRPTRGLGVREYAVSKLANVLFTAELARRLAGSDVHSYALHPGVVATEVWREVPWPLRGLMKLGMISAEQGARTTLYCATSPEVAQHSGRYYDECREVEPSQLAQDPALAAELWQRSEAWTQA